jgi:hypothetical protein
MPFPASRRTLSKALDDACLLALQMRDQMITVRAVLAAGPTRASVILDIEPRLRGFRSELVATRDVPGIGPYAQEQLGDATLNVAAEFNGMIAGIDNTIAWIRANFPTDANGWLLAQTFGAAGREDRTFTAAATAGLRTQLDALISTVG